MTFLWVITGAALALAAAAWIRAQRLAARVAQLSDMYWELKYQHLELRKQIERIPGAERPPEPPAAPRVPNESFVPLTSLRR
jgi:hypothetical protein